MEIDYQAKLSEAVMKIETKGKAYAIARGQSFFLQEMRKVVLAEQVRAQEPSLSMSERESIARTSEAYVNHLKGTAEAIRAELVSRAEYERWSATLESLRSLCSQETARIKAIGGSDLETH